MFKDSVERIVLDLEAEAALVLFPLGVTLSHWISCFHAVKTKCQYLHFCAYVKNPLGQKRFNGRTIKGLE